MQKQALFNMLYLFFGFSVNSRAFSPSAMSPPGNKRRCQSLSSLPKDAHEKEPRSPRKVSSTPTYRNIALGFHVLCYGHLALL